MERLIDASKIRVVEASQAAQAPRDGWLSRNNRNRKIIGEAPGASCSFCRGNSPPVCTRSSAPTTSAGSRSHCTKHVPKHGSKTTRTENENFQPPTNTPKNPYRPPTNRLSAEPSNGTSNGGQKPFQRLPTGCSPHSPYPLLRLEGGRGRWKPAPSNRGFQRSEGDQGDHGR